MRQLTLQIPEHKYPFFMELMSSFDYVTFNPAIIASTAVEREDTFDEVLSNVRHGIRELNLINQGKLKTRPAKELIHEL